jgi:hypothetical protein
LIRGASGPIALTIKSRLLLGRILFEQGQQKSIEESIQILEEGYRYDPIATGAELVKNLLAIADFQDDEDGKLEIYEHVLSIDTNQPIAQEKTRSIWRIRGNVFLQQGKFTEAINAFKKSGDLKKIEAVQQAEQENWKNEAEVAIQQDNLPKALELYKLLGDEMKVSKITESIDKQWKAAQLLDAENFEKSESWEQALQIYDSILEKQPDEEYIFALKKKSEEESSLANLYRQAITYVRVKNTKDAQSLFGQIVSIRPKYKDAARYLYETVEDEQFPQKETSAFAKTVQTFGTATVIGITGFLFLCVGGVIFGLIATFGIQNNPTLSSIVGWGGLALSGLISLGVMIHISRLAFGQRSKRKRG